MKRCALILLCVLLSGSLISAAQTVGYQLDPVDFTQIKLHPGFWQTWQKKAVEVTVGHCFDQCEQRNKIKHFEIAAGRAEGKWSSTGPWDDSDVFKVIEGASYALALENNPALDAYLDQLISTIAAAQEPDGYLHTWRSIDPNYPPGAWWASDQRWGNLGSGHELYNSGHLFEAAVAHYQATGKRSLLDVAVKNADLICSVFGPGGNTGVPGHEEIELALVRLYSVTGSETYLQTAEFFLENRGGKYDKTLQGHQHVALQETAEGHVVRAMYLYSGMADLASILPHPEYYAALNKIWMDIISHKLYITGSMGSKHESEAFGEPWELPNREAYTETCGSIGGVFFNHRMFLRDPDARYIDVLERTMYNGVLSGIELSGDKFSYRNPLESDPQLYGSRREEWNDCPCCPTNLARFLPSLSRYMYAVKSDTIYLNMFSASTADLQLDCDRVSITQKTHYPWDGRVEMTVRTDRKRPFTLRIRMPGWALNQPAPSDLYSYTRKYAMPTLSLNGISVPLDIHKGYVQFNRTWNPGDKIVLDMPMPVRTVISNPAVQANRGRVALERGPLVYCFESLDNGPIQDIALDKNAEFSVVNAPDMLGGIHRIDIRTSPGKQYAAIPYYARSNRQPCDMIVWVKSQETSRQNPE